MGGLNDRPPNAAGTILGRKKTPEDIEFEKERAEREAALTRDVQQRRAHLEEIRALIFENSKWALSSKSVNQKEKAELQKNRGQLNETLQLLDKLLSVSTPARQADVLYFAGELLRCGIALGRFTKAEKKTPKYGPAFVATINIVKKQLRRGETLHTIRELQKLRPDIFGRTEKDARALKARYYEARKVYGNIDG
ncbi:hypothetical protein [Methylocystis rosea]|uniref:hypothetical protein n=1 Tax=Methylocystis rosea TaxID=173366 RepID=UPI0003A78239|nr:hypothetical protein [Methylocystis rosea]